MGFGKVLGGIAKAGLGAAAGLAAGRMIGADKPSIPMSDDPARGGITGRLGSSKPAIKTLPFGGTQKKPVASRSLGSKR